MSDGLEASGAGARRGATRGRRRGTDTPASARLEGELAAALLENAGLQQQVEEQRRRLSEVGEQQTATAGILRVIARSPTDPQRVLDAIAETAARLCDAGDATILRIEGDRLRRVAHYGPLPTGPDQGAPLNRGSVVGRAAADRVTVHVEDLTTLSADEFPLVRDLQRRTGIRTMLATPLVREGASIGVLTIRRAAVRPFTEQQIALLEAFADQAVIAIENARLFSELQASNRTLTEALAQQTATAEILRVIASTPTDAQQVLQVIVAQAARLCDAADAVLFRIEGDRYRSAVRFGPHQSQMGPVDVSFLHSEPCRRMPARGRRWSGAPSTSPTPMPGPTWTSTSRRPSSGRRASAVGSRRPCCGTARPSAPWWSTARSLGRSPTNRSRCWRPSPTRP